MHPRRVVPRPQSTLRLLALAVFVTCFAAGVALANPAAQVTREYRQPDGSRVALRLWGDEFANGWETLEGYTALRVEESGWWYFAEQDASGALTPSARRVGLEAPPAPARLRPIGQALQNNIDQFGGTLSGGPRPEAAPAWASGNTNVLVILVQFPADPGDPQGAQPAVNASFTAAQVQTNLFGGTSTGPGNWTDYYDQVSFGNLHVLGTVVGPFTVANDKNDYDDGPSSAGALVAEAIALADASVDFAQYDNDGNGQVDMVAIAYAGNGPDNGLYDGANSTINNIWPHASSIGAVAVDGGARTVSQYFMAPELLNSSPRLRTIGVYCHEFGHKLGLPDLYDTDNSSDGLGHWCLMASGSWCSNTPGSENGESPSHMSAWCKQYMGWITATDRTDQQVGQAIPQAETNAYAVRMLANPGGPNDWPAGTGEYFLIENRQRTGFDRGLDGCGIVVFHVDESKTSNAAEGHTAGTHRLVDLEEADGTPQELDNGTNRGDSGDPFPGSTNNRQWDGASNPGSDLYDGSDSNQRMRVLSGSCNANMNVSFNNLPPVANAGPDQLNVECTGSSGATVNLNGSSSSDPDGDALTYTWSATGITFSNPNSATPSATFPSGTTVVTLTVSDGIESDTDQMSVRVVDTTPPTIACPASIQVECTQAGGTPATDPAIAAFLTGATATDACDPNPVITNNGPAFFPDGVTTVTFTATDDATNASVCQANVEVIDTTPPVITVSLSRDVLWPPNHKLADIHATIAVTDICDPNPTFVLTSITSDEPDNGLGDGDTSGDIANATYGAADVDFRLRSERMGGGDGRVYTIIYTASDESGNTATDTAWVRVPHSRSGSANAVAGFADGGLRLDANAPTFSVVIPTSLDYEARRIDPRAACVGNTQFVLAPESYALSDVTGDGRLDLVLTYRSSPVSEEIALAAELVEESMPGGVSRDMASVGGGATPEVEPIALHFVSGGVDWVIEDLFGLGAPLAWDGSGATLLTDARGEVVTGAAAMRPAEPTPAPAPAPAPIAGRASFDGRTLTILEAGHVRLELFNVLGRRIRTVVDSEFGAGRHELRWDGLDVEGRRAPSGVYFYRLAAPGLQSRGKLGLIH